MDLLSFNTLKNSNLITRQIIDCSHESDTFRQVFWLVAYVDDDHRLSDNIIIYMLCWEFSEISTKIDRRGRRQSSTVSACCKGNVSVLNVESCDIDLYHNGQIVQRRSPISENTLVNVPFSWISHWTSGMCDASLSQMLFQYLSISALGGSELLLLLRCNLESTLAGWLGNILFILLASPAWCFSSARWPELFVSVWQFQM